MFQMVRASELGPEEVLFLKKEEPFLGDLLALTNSDDKEKASSPEKQEFLFFFGPTSKAYALICGSTDLRNAHCQLWSRDGLTEEAQIELITMTTSEAVYTLDMIDVIWEDQPNGCVRQAAAALSLEITGNDDMIVLTDPAKLDLQKEPVR